MPSTIAGDTFVEATTDTLLQSHIPTGTNAGAGWAAKGSASILVRAATDDAGENNNADGNRYRMTTDLGTSQMDVQAEFGGTPGVNIFPGVRFRVNATDTSFGEFSYDNGRWEIHDGTTTVVSSAEAWPGGVVTMLAEIRTGTMIGKVNGVTKVTLSSNLLNTNTYAGLLLGNFGGSALSIITADNFLATSFDSVGSSTRGRVIGGTLIGSNCFRGLVG